VLDPLLELDQLDLKPPEFTGIGLLVQPLPAVLAGDFAALPFLTLYRR
jgi:hypothetical protein